ncbi:MAG: response regulator [Bacteroidetes bacterium]|nr:response regulator [Rhodothermia bacterium]MCS7156083.1 response regulator [Bacteroidota bacterium]MCX7907771.1 response regulator [Bacteroidota bacterium]MDW8137900.1 response regulator [Bacteroidota bacterium]MDW8286249.1 response regulator [Bacteroidota bacterium]
MELTVLVVDDSPTMRRIICNTLDRIGYRNHVEAENGQQAWEIIQKGGIQFVLTDWNMPEMNGLELVTAIRQSPTHKDLPIIMITTKGMTEEVLEAVKAGVNNYIVKPFTPEVLEEKIKAVLAKMAVTR